MAGGHTVEEHLTDTGVEGLSFEGRPTAFIHYIIMFYFCFARLHYYEVGKIIGADESAAHNAEEGGGVVAHLGYDEGEPFVDYLLVVVALSGCGVEESFEHHLQRVLYGGYASWGVEIALLFALQGVGGMVGANGVDKSVKEAAP